MFSEYNINTYARMNMHELEMVTVFFATSFFWSNHVICTQKLIHLEHEDWNI